MCSRTSWLLKLSRPAKHACNRCKVIVIFFKVKLLKMSFTKLNSSISVDATTLPCAERDRKKANGIVTANFSSYQQGSVTSLKVIWRVMASVSPEGPGARSHVSGTVSSLSERLLRSHCVLLFEMMIFSSLLYNCWIMLVKKLHASCPIYLHRSLSCTTGHPMN